jgi:predicted phage gp36 major capsid-like protein
MLANFFKKKLEQFDAEMHDALSVFEKTLDKLKRLNEKISTDIDLKSKKKQEIEKDIKAETMLMIRNAAVMKNIESVLHVKEDTNKGTKD